MIRIVFVTLIATITVQGQQTSFEQKAFDYFFSEIFSGKYQEEKIVRFGGQTEKSLSQFGHYNNCFTGEEDIRKSLYDKAEDEVLPAKKIDTWNNHKAVIKKKRNRLGLNLYLFQANEVNQKVYVMIEIVQPDYYTNVYVFEFDIDGKLLRTCRTGVTH